MKTTTTKTEPTREHTTDHYTCDRCGQPCGDSEETRSSYDVRRADIELKSGQKIDLTIGGAGATATIYGIRKVLIETKDGDQYPEGANLTAQVIDCCAECFETVVIPALKALGFKTRAEDRGW